MHNEIHAADKVWSLPANIQIGAPTIAFVNPKTGVAQIATSRYDQPPPGYIKQEIKGSIERTKFENLQSEIHAREDDIYNENIRQKREDARRNLIDDIKANTSSDADKSDNSIATKQLMNKAIEHIRNKPAVPKKRKTEFRFDVNHKDKSNL